MNEVKIIVDGVKDAAEADLNANLKALALGQVAFVAYAKAKYFASPTEAAALWDHKNPEDRWQWASVAQAVKNALEAKP